MEITRIVTGKYKINTYIVVENNEAVLIDAGATINQIKEKLPSDVKVMAIIITHVHFDHIENLDNLSFYFRCPVYVSRCGVSSLYNSAQNLSVMEEPFVISKDVQIVPIDDNEKINLIGKIFSIITTAGHCESSICVAVDDVMFTGDTLFAVCVGRTDIATANIGHYKKSIDKLLKLSPSRIYYSGHGSSFDYERAQKVLIQAKEYFENI